jgi:hypothetical protein
MALFADVKKVSAKSLERRMSRMNSEEVRISVSQESKLKRRPSSLGDFLHSGKYLARSESPLTSALPTRQNTVKAFDDIVEEEEHDAFILPDIGPRETLGSLIGLGSSRRSFPKLPQTRYVLRSKASMPNLTFKKETTPYQVANSPLTPVDLSLKSQKKSLSETSPWLSPSPVRHPVRQFALYALRRAASCY